jgi:hypothetical protein
VIPFPQQGTYEYNRYRMKRYMQHQAGELTSLELGFLEAQWSMAQAGWADITWDQSGVPLFQINEAGRKAAPSWIEWPEKTQDSMHAVGPGAGEEEDDEDDEDPTGGIDYDPSEWDD